MTRQEFCSGFSLLFEVGGDMHSSCCSIVNMSFYNIVISSLHDTGLSIRFSVCVCPCEYVAVAIKVAIELYLPLVFY